MAENLNVEVEEESETEFINKFKAFKIKANKDFGLNIDLSYNDYISNIDSVSENVKQLYATSGTNKFEKRVFDIVRSLNPINDIDEMNAILDSWKRDINKEESWTKEERYALLLQVETTRALSSKLYNNRLKLNNSNNGLPNIQLAPKFSCKWYQWVCVGASTGAAVALSAAAGPAAIIIAGGGVAAVAACCICGCKCRFSHTCS